MPANLRSLLLRAPSLAGLLVCVFLALFALDAFDGRPVSEALPAFFMHLLPAATVALVVAAAWRHPWMGAAGFGGLALAYALSVPSRPDWILAISGPLVVTSALYVLAAIANRRSTPVR